MVGRNNLKSNITVLDDFSFELGARSGRRKKN